MFRCAHPTPPSRRVREGIIPSRPPEASFRFPLAAGGILSILLIACLALPALAGQAPLDAAQREAALAKIEAAQQNIKTIRIAMHEERRFAALSTPLRYTGTIFFDRASRLVFLHYTTPVDSIMRLEGGQVLLWVKGSPTADVMDMGQAQGVAARPDIFAVTIKDFGGQVFDDGDTYRLEDAARGAAGKSLSVVVDKGTLLAKTVVIRDAGGDTTRLVFEDVAINRPLPPEVVRFRLPPGTRQNKVVAQ